MDNYARLRSDATQVYTAALAAAQPDAAVKKALAGRLFGQGRLVLVAIGKAGWKMAAAACDELAGRIDAGVVITKYGHLGGPLPPLTLCEAGHPVPDENSVAATALALKAVENLTAQDTVLFLVSGGGSALFEQPLVPLAELEALTKQLLASGADIVEMNTVRKRLSAVKGGRFAQLCAPAQVFSIVLSDIIGDPLDMIASGPAYPDASTSAEALAILEKYRIQAGPRVLALMREETPKTLPNVHTEVTGSVRQLCAAAREVCARLGYEAHVLADDLHCTARDAGSFMASIARYHSGGGRAQAFLAGGETVVKLTGTGKGGRNQEIALAAAEGIAGLPNVAVFSLGSDGTDGPTDAAGGYVDGRTRGYLAEQGLSIHAVLNDNDAYTALSAVDGLIITGPTGTNVNDLMAVLILP